MTDTCPHCGARWRPSPAPEDQGTDARVLFHPRGCPYHVPGLDRSWGENADREAHGNPVLPGEVLMTEHPRMAYLSEVFYEVAVV